MTFVAGWQSAMIAVGALLTALALTPAAAFAQAAPTGVSASPAGDTHVSGSWAMRCYRAGNLGCDLTQVSYMRGKNLRVATVAIGFIPASNQYIGRFVVPLGVSLAQGLSLNVGSFRASNLKYRRCERDGCYVEGVVPAAFIEAMQAPGAGKGMMRVVSVDGRTLGIPIVLDGFAAGLALLKQRAIDKTPAGTIPKPDAAKKNSRG